MNNIEKYYVPIWVSMESIWKYIKLNEASYIRRITDKERLSFFNIEYVEYLWKIIDKKNCKWKTFFNMENGIWKINSNYYSKAYNYLYCNYVLVLKNIENKNQIDFYKEVIFYMEILNIVSWDYLYNAWFFDECDWYKWKFNRTSEPIEVYKYYNNYVKVSDIKKIKFLLLECIDNKSIFFFIEKYNNINRTLHLDSRKNINICLAEFISIIERLCLKNDDEGLSKKFSGYSSHLLNILKYKKYNKSYMKHLYWVRSSIFHWDDVKEKNLKGLNIEKIDLSFVKEIANITQVIIIFFIENPKSTFSIEEKVLLVR